MIDCKLLADVEVGYLSFTFIPGDDLTPDPHSICVHPPVFKLILPTQIPLMLLLLLGSEILLEGEVHFGSPVLPLRRHGPLTGVDQLQFIPGFNPSICHNPVSEGFLIVFFIGMGEQTSISRI